MKEENLIDIIIKMIKEINYTWNRDFANIFAT